MPTSTWSRITIGLAAVVSAGIIWVTGGELDSGLIRPVVTGASIVTVGLLGFDQWFWRWPGFQLLHRVPVLHGTWKAELTTTFEDRASSPIECYLVVDQTFSKIQVRMLFDRSQSKSVSGDLVDEGGACMLYYLFRSEKHATEPDTNPMSRGAASMTVGRRPSIHLEGDYWMDVGTKGRVETVGYSKHLFDTFRGARSGAYS